VSFDRAASFRLGFGKYAGRTIDQVAETDEGLLYLDWLLGEMQTGGTVYAGARDALDAYLADTTVARELEELLDRG